MTPTTETRVPIILDKPRVMIFNANAMCAYEEATGKFYLDTVASLYEVMKPALAAMQETLANQGIKKSAFSEEDLSKQLSAVVGAINPMDMVRKVPMKDLRAMVWASIHEYDSNDEPYWPLTLTQVGRLLQMTDIPRIFTGLMRGQVKNSPTVSEMGESQAVGPKSEEVALPKIETDGGEPSIELPAAAFI